MKQVLLIIFLLILKISLSQSKKEQIQILTNRLDSLNQVVNSQSITINDKISQISGLNTKITNLESSISSLNADISILNYELQGNKNEIATKSQQLSNLQAQLKTKTDSLSLVLNELEKLKPAPKLLVVNNTNSNASKQITQTNSYKSVKIGTQTWMAENLNVSTFRNGDTILEAKTDEEWNKAGQDKKPAWCYFNNDPKNGVKYGKLYNWYAVNDPRGLAPSGWHVTTDAEWTTLENYLGDEAGNKMKSKSGWKNYTSGGSKTCPNCKNWNDEYRRKTPCHKCKDKRWVPAPEVIHSGNGTNSSGFSGLPGGYRNHVGTFGDIGKNGYWWRSTEDGTSIARTRYLIYYSGGVSSFNSNNGEGFSVRCLRD
jgi:uncharacterized protein (TIGR02145 family)